MKRKPLILILLVFTLSALAFQAVRTAQSRRALVSASLTTYAPPGALLSIESPDFAGLLRSWNDSVEQKAWLASSNYSVFSNSRLFSRLSDAETQFAQASGVPAQTLLPQVAGKQSLFTWYDVGNLEFLYITRMDASQAAQSDLLKTRGKWSARNSAGLPFFVRTSTDATSGTRRTVAYATANGLFLLATREDLIAQALQLIATPNPASSLAQDPWFQQADAVLKPAGDAPLLHMVLNLDRLVPMAYFRTYWVQRNITEMKQYRASVADLYRERSSFREERALLLKDPGPAPTDPDLGALTALAPGDGVFRAVATTDPAAAIAALDSKLLGREKTVAASWDEAPDPSLATPQSGNVADLETRIDTLPPVSALASDAALTSAIQAAKLESIMTFSSASMPATGLFVPVHNAVVLRGSGWNAQAIAQALQQSLRGALTTGTLGIEFRPTPIGGATVYNLAGPRPLAFAVSGPYLLLADDEPLLKQLVAAASQSSPAPVFASQLSGFDHASQREPYQRVTRLIDGPPAARPAFFSQNIASLSQAFAAFTSERFQQSREGEVVRQTVVYRWQP